MTVPQVLRLQGSAVQRIGLHKFNGLGVGIRRVDASIRQYSWGNADSKNRFAQKFDKPRVNNRRVLKFELDNFTTKGRSAISSIISQVRAGNTNYRVKVVDKGKLVEKHLVDIVNSLNPLKEGIQLVPSNGKDILVKKVTNMEMLKAYSDELAKEAENLLIQQGSSSVMRSLRSKERADKKKSAIKIVNLNWHISLSDLKQQKRAEIVKRAAKGQKFQIMIDNRKNKRDTTLDMPYNFSESNHDQLELKRRQLIRDEIESALEETETAFETSGRIATVLTYNCSPKVKASEDKSKGKDGKKQARQVKKQPKKIEEEDLDALYLLKIED